MAGVIGQSQQACRNCTASRVTCDLVKPQCTPCKQVGRVCTGAGRALVFKTVTTPTTASRRRRSSTNTTPNVTQSWAASSLSTTAEQDRHIGFFWQVYLPHGEPFPDEAGHYTTCGWTRVARDICDGNDGGSDSATVVRLAITANSLCMLGSQYHEPRMMKDGQQVYGQALLQMRSVLQRHQSRENKMDDKLALIIASRLLTVFTMLFGGGDPSAREETTPTAQGQAWVGLNSGEMALVMSSPPAEYQTGAAHQVFVDTRLNLYLPSLIVKSRTALASTAWMTEPWAFVVKTPLDRLVDLVALIPALAEDLTALNVGSLSETAKIEAKKELRPQFLSFVADMKRWFDDVVPGLGIDTLVSGQTRTSKTKATSVMDLAKAHTLVLFWATCLMFRGGLLQVLTQPEDIPATFINVYAIRYNMLRVLSNVLFLPVSKSQGCWYGINIALFPLRTVLGTIGDENDEDDDRFPLSPAEMEFMRAIAKECKARGVASFLDSMGRYVSEADAKD
ncbi:hypothetical protein SBRCBS47491_000890 [Sporothrix bragantina]|uniref:Zn(2)-C6 fungal-type domain-containing protein n=1 Tax=Sporothrix bragantina TaxID=671064 RepID=A0ABP0AU25_9PEZI